MAPRLVNRMYHCVPTAGDDRSKPKLRHTIRTSITPETPRGGRTASAPAVDDARPGAVESMATPTGSSRARRAERKIHAHQVATDLADLAEIEADRPREDHDDAHHGVADRTQATAAHNSPRPRRFDFRQPIRREHHSAGRSICTSFAEGPYRPLAKSATPRDRRRKIEHLEVGHSCSRLAPS